MENTTNEYPSAVPAQVQPHQPGDQEKMHPEPEIIKASHKGSEKLKGKVAVISGGDSGIGRSVAVLFAREGADIAVLYLEEDQDAEITKQLVEKEGQHCLLLKGDISDADLAKQNIDKVLQHFGKINILVNNVGGGGAGRESPYEISVNEFERVFQMNVFSMWRLCQLVSPHMKSSGYGSIINMSSMASINKSPAISAYASSKAAINHMTRNLAFDFGPEIRINAVGPGAIRTQALQTVLTPEIEKTMLKHTPLERLGEPEDIAGAVLYFAAPVSVWVSGQVLFVNGGGVQTLD